MFQMRNDLLAITDYNIFVLLGSNCFKIEPCHISIVCKFVASEGE